MIDAQPRDARLVEPPVGRGLTGHATTGGSFVWDPGRWLPALVTLGCLVVVVVGSASANRLYLAAVLVAAFSFAIVSLRWPLAPLFALAAVIPIDELGSFGPLGSPGRIAAIAFFISYGLRRGWAIRLDVIPIAGWAYLAWLALSVGWALDPQRTVGELGTLVQLVVLAVLVADAVIEQPAIVRPILWTYSVSAALTGVVAVAAALGSQSGTIDRLAAFGGQDAAQFAAILVPAFVFALFELVDRRLTGLAMAVVAATLAGIVLSGTRGAWVSVAVVGAATLLLRVPRQRLLSAAGAVAIMLVLILQLPGVTALVTSRADDAISSGGAGRTDIWTVGLHIFESAPIVGVGFANFPVAMTAPEVRHAGILDPALVGSGPHNIVISTATELGIVGLMLLVPFVLSLLLRPGRPPDAIVVKAVLASLMIDALFLDVLSNRKQVWLLLGIVAGLTWFDRRAEATADRRRLGTPVAGPPEPRRRVVATVRSWPRTRQPMARRVTGRPEPSR